MSPLDGLATGFGVALAPENLFACFVGAVLGTIVGMLPGFGPLTGMVILLPITFGLPPVTAIIMLAGIYYGSMYGGTITSVLMAIPGEAATAVTILDGRPMALAGRAGPALGIAAIGSFLAGTGGVVALTFLALPLAGLALAFGPAEYCALILGALIAVGALTDAPAHKGLTASVLGLLIATVGIDPISGSSRMTFGITPMLGGISLIAVIVGLFGLAEVVQAHYAGQAVGGVVPLGSPYPTRADLRRAAPAYVRGGVIGFALGILPGAGASVSAFASYAAERRISNRKWEFGKGAIEGVAGPEAANNAATSGSMVPALALGLPGSGGTALLLAALILHGVRPGPLLFEQQPDVAWGVIASMYVGNVILLILNLPLVGIFARLLLIPTNLMIPIVLCLASTGVWITGFNLFNVIVMMLFGFIGFYMQRANYPLAPVVLGLVLGGQLETTFRQAVSIAHGDVFRAFIEPIPVAIMIVTAGILVAAHVASIIRRVRGSPNSAIGAAGSGQ